MIDISSEAENCILLKKWRIHHEKVVYPLLFSIFVEESGIFGIKRGVKIRGWMRGGRMGKFGAETGPVLIVGVGVV